MQNLVVFFSPISSVFDNVQCLWKKKPVMAVRIMVRKGKKKLLTQTQYSAKKVSVIAI